MIYTFTPNPAIDHYIDLPAFERNRVNRADYSFFTVAGKGINCSMVFELLGIENTACYFSAGFTGSYISETLKNKKYTVDCPFETEGYSRVNIKFLGKEDTAINTRGPYITDKCKKEILDYVTRCKEDDHFMISGSLPVNYSKRDLMELCKILNSHKTKIILDIPGLRPYDIRDIDIYLIKPNLEELNMFFDQKIGMNNYREYVDRLLGSGVRNVLLSLGKDGSYYAGEHGQYSIYVPDIEVYSTVGAGDCLLAGYMAGDILGRNIEDKLKMANACALARVANEHFDNMDQIREYYDEISIIKE